MKALKFKKRGVIKKEITTPTHSCFYALMFFAQMVIVFLLSCFNAYCLFIPMSVGKLTLDSIPTGLYNGGAFKKPLKIKHSARSKRKPAEERVTLSLTVLKTKIEFLFFLS